jgi:lysophospholipase L1-like esterase
VLPTIPWSADAAHAKSIPGLNSQLQSLYRAYPQIVPGPDLYDFFMRHPEEISADGVHPTEQGCAAMRALWADSAARSLYSRR